MISPAAVGIELEVVSNSDLTHNEELNELVALINCRLAVQMIKKQLQQLQMVKRRHLHHLLRLQEKHILPQMKIKMIVNKWIMPSRNMRKMTMRKKKKMMMMMMM